MAPDSRVVDLLLQCALVVRVALGTTPELELLAEVITAFTADATLSARYTDFESHTIADFEAGNLCPDAYNLASRLMSK